MNRLETILQSVWKRSRFTSYFYQAVQFRKEPEIPTLVLHAADSRLHLLYNPAFVERTDTEELIGLLVHEMMHILLNHDHRLLPGHDPVLQNLAQDMVVNTCLTDWRDTFFSRTHLGKRDYPPLVLPARLPQVPQDFLTDNPSRRKEDIAWEELYRWMAEVRKTRREKHETQDASQNFQLHRLQKERMPFAEPPDCNYDGFSLHSSDGAFLPTGIHLFQRADEKKNIHALKNRLIQYALQDDECRNDRIFQHLSVLLQKVQKPDSSFSRKLLKSHVEEASLADDWKYTSSRFDRRYFASGLYAPGRAYGKKMTVTVAVDVSGSMVVHPDHLEKAFGVVESLLGHYKVFLLCIDEEVFIPRKHEGKFLKSDTLRNFYAYRKGDWRLIQSGNSGTTFFASLFGRFMRGHHEPLVVITDGDIYDLDRLPVYWNTLWVIAGKREKRFDPPFGKVAMLNDTDR